MISANNVCGLALFGLVVLGVWWALRGPEVEREHAKLRLVSSR